MDSKTIFENYLLILKSTVEVYIHGTLESSNELVRDTLKKSLNEILTIQADTYNLMTKNDWYSVNNVSENIIKNTLNKVENES